MSLWTNKDEAAGKPKNLTTAEKAITFGVSNDETTATAGVAHSGWVQKTTGTGGRSGRTFYETLVAMGTMTTDGTSSVTTQNRTITISGQPGNLSKTVGQSATFTVTASVSPADSATLSYQWQKQESGAGAWADVTGATSASYTISSVASGDNTDKYRAVVSAEGASPVTSDPATLTVA